MRVTSLLLTSALAVACGNEPTTTQVPETAGPEASVDQPDLLPEEVAPDTALRTDYGVEEAFDFYTELPGGGCKPGDGCFGNPCSSNEECLEGWCVTHMGEGVCTRHCQDECPPGWECRQVGSGGPDLVSVCISQFTHLCRPCSTGADCKSLVTVEDVCVDYGPQGSFCGGACDPSAIPGEGKVCPWGFTCKEAQTVDGITLHQCVADAGVCPCTATSVELGLWTPCQTASEWGTCKGKRVCGPDGLSECSASIPAIETCNGVDDDCDAATDEPAQQGGNYINLCDDGNECTQDSCEGAAGCQQVPLDVGECKDDDVCTVGDHCVAGQCVGTPALCDDKNPCTDDACDGLGGCTFQANQAKCDDADPCTVADQCEQTVCSGVAVSCDCQEDADCKALEDGDLCNGVLHCDTDGLPFQCAVLPGSPVVCPEPEGKDAICQVASCEPATGKCGLAPVHEGFACNDGDACTVGDMCQAGKCVSGVAASCADDNPCTDDSCQPATGCLHVPNTQPCTDFDTCTLGDACAGGVCVPGAALACDDGNVCTDDSCDKAKGCLHVANQEMCDDGNECTLLDYCAGGQCVSSGDKKCDDSNPCTKDYCLALKGCVFEPAPGPCSDGNPCTLNDSCQAGKCIPGPAPDCDDGNPCTTDSCGPDGTCKHLSNQEMCDDSNACTEKDHCDAGKCVYGGLADCDDGNVCTTDSCDPKLGCVHKVNQNPCDDGDA
ncbi:MAG: hypothetical protein FJ109_20140, partial [Deltaproteobacteria bacterium]|nr:hypothetical protein [Deltaproteobacteria bacterium]